MTNYVAAIEAIMDVPRQFRPDQEASWHAIAPEILVPDDQVQVSDMATTAADILISFPYGEAAQAVAMSAQETTAFRQARFLRKVFMIGRDSLRLTTSLRLGDEPELLPLSLLSRQIGLLADYQAQDPRLVDQVLEALSRAQTAASSLGRLSGLGVLEPPEVRRGCAYSYDAESLAINNYDHEHLIYHGHRKGFRRLVHLGIVSQLVEPSEAKQSLINQGIEMNRRYGHHHEHLRLVASGLLVVSPGDTWSSSSPSQSQPIKQQ